jgi:hypothetical protein
MKIGDRVKLSSSGRQQFPEWADTVGEGVITDKNSYFLVMFDNHPSELINPAYLLEGELELVEKKDNGPLPVGTRVRCINTTDLNGSEGTVVSNTGVAAHPYRIQWDNRVGNPLDHPHSHGGSWSNDAIEVITEEDEDDTPTALEVKDSALRIAAFVFGQYREQHLAKETPEATMKALMNMGLEQLMNDALEAG